MCDGLPIPAERDAAVVEHLHRFLDEVEGWIAERAEASDVERDALAATVAEQRATLRTLRVRAQRAHEEYRRLLDADDAGDIATDALRIAVRVEREVTDLEAMINAADARLADWPTVSAVTAALDFYAGLRDAIAGRIDTAETIVETNAALRTVLEDANLAVRDGKVWGEFFIRADGRMRIGHLGGLNEDLPDNVMEFFPDDIAGRAPPELVGRTERQTLVYRCPGGLHEPDGSTPRYGLARNPTAAMPAGLVLDTVRSAPSDG